MDCSTLKKLQAIEFEILCAFDSYCAKYNISYSLYAGTALGAVRHGGFIPWDDDIDIAMTRVDFDRLCKIWKIAPVQGYYLQSILTDEHCGTCHAKLRKDGTVFLSSGELDDKEHHGIWIDIFPLDKAPSNNNDVKNKKISLGRELILLTRANVDMQNDSFIKKAFRCIIRLIPLFIRKKRIHKIHEWLVTHMDDGIDDGYHWLSLSTWEAVNDIRYLPENIEGYTKIMFNDRLFPIFKNYHGYLTQAFGDYMKLPPEAERVCKHSPKKISF